MSNRIVGALLKRLHAAALMVVLSIRNVVMRRSLISPAGPVVSLTSHGQRLRSVHLALEAIARGAVLPSELILWLEPEDMGALSLPKIQRLVRRGLTVSTCQPVGPHAKYWPYISGTAVPNLLVTADDDVLYPTNWLSQLVCGHHARPDLILCHRALQMALTDEGSIAPYRWWSTCSSSVPGPLVFATGVSGVIYPVEFLRLLKEAGTKFLEQAPTADDVWINRVALESGWSVAQLSAEGRMFPLTLFTQSVALWRDNVINARNDAQITTAYAIPGLRRLLAAGQVSPS